MKARIRSGDFVIRNSSFVLFLLLATCHLPVATAQEIVTSTPIHNRAYNPANPLFVLAPAGNQTGDDQQWKDGAGTVVTWVDKNGVLHTSGGSAGLIRSINGLTAFDQFLTVGCTSGLDVNIQPNVDTNAICFPDASATARGLVTTGAQVFGGNKVFNNDLATNGAFSALGVSSQAQSNISAVTFTGAGLDDLTAGGTYTADNSLAYCVAIDGTGPDTFSWGTGGSCVNGALTVAITGAAQTLSNGITVTFAAVLGHTLTNQWDFVASEVAPLALADATGTPILTCHNSGAGCPVGGFPRLDQVLDPTADKSFDIGTHYLEFQGSTGASSDFFFSNVVGPRTVATAHTFDWELDIQTDATGDFAGSGTLTPFKVRATDHNNAATSGLVVGVQSTSIASTNTNSTTYDMYSFYGANSYAGSGTEGIRNSYVVFADPFSSTGGGTIKNNFGYYFPDQTEGTNIYGYYSAQNAGTSKWAFYGAGTAASHFGGTTDAPRFKSSGTALVAGDFVPSGGWGASGSVAVTSASTDQSFHITVTAAGAGQALNPTVAITFKDGTWTTVPIYVCSMETGGTGALSFFTPDNTSATVLTLTYAGTPTVNLTYQVACNAWGH